MYIPTSCTYFAKKSELTKNPFISPSKKKKQIWSPSLKSIEKVDANITS
jgi:hypothetical protein